MPHEQPTQPNTAETYEMHFWRIVELLGRPSARNQTNYRNERPRTEEHIGRQEELIAMLEGVADYLGA